MVGFSRSRAAVLCLAAAGALATGCEVVTPSNPFDPETPGEQQAPATLRGVVVLDDATASAATLAGELAGVTLTLRDELGRPVAGADGNPVTLPLAIAGNRGSFGVELAPQTVRIDIAGVGGRYTTRPALAALPLAPGAVVDVGDLVFAFAPSSEGGGPGAITGVVRLEGGSGESRTVRLYARSDEATAPGAATPQRLVATTTTATDGSFAFDRLAVGTYAIEATLTDFTPDYRTDVLVSDDGQGGLARTFAGAAALTLHPITAVLLPQLDRQDGVFYTRDDVVDLAVLAFGGVTGMRLRAVACDQPAPACATVAFVDEGAGAEPFATYAATTGLSLPDVEGRVGLFAQFEARSGFVFASPVFSTTVFRDTTRPLVNSVARFGEAPADEIIATDDDVNITIAADDAGGIDGVGVVVRSVLDAVPAVSEVVFSDVTTPPGPASLTRGVALPTGDGVFFAWIFVRDRAGNVVEAPTAVRIRKDTAPAAPLPIVVDAIEPREGRGVAVHLHFDAAGATELPASLQLGLRALPADAGSGRVAYDPLGSYVVEGTAADGEAVQVRARLYDEVDNVTEVDVFVDVTLRGAITGVADVERIGQLRELAGTLVTATGADGALLASTVTGVDGSWSLPSVREGRVTVTARRDGHRSFSQDLAFVEAGETTRLDALLPLRRGALVGRFRLADAVDVDGRHSGIRVEARLESQLRDTSAKETVTGGDGDFAFDTLPATIVGETWRLTATLDGYAQAQVEQLAVDDNGLTVANPDPQAPTTPLAVLLQPISGDFDLCAATAASGDCAPIAFVGGASVRVHLRADQGVTRIRAAATSLPDDAALPLVAYDDGENIAVTLPDVQGAVAIFVEVEVDGGRQVLGPVEVFRDTVAPAAPDVVISRGSKARRDGFTNEGFVRAVVSDNDGTLDPTRDSPLLRAPTFFSADVPDEPRSVGVALCALSTSCTVLLPSLAGVVDEGVHELFAYVCDAAGNCSATAGSDRIVYDETPPSALHGVSFAPSGALIADAGNGRFITPSGAYAVTVGTGAAQTAGGQLVVDVDGAGVRDVDALALSFVAAIDDDDAVELVGAETPGSLAVVAGLPLLGGEADYDVFARFIDAAGNATAVEPNPFTFRLTLDETAPSARLVLADGGALTRSRTVAARLDNTSEAGTAKLVADAADCGSAAGYVSFASLPATHLLADLDGTQLVIACLQDAVGNVAFASDSVTLDRVAPTGSVVLDGGAALNADRSLTATFTNVSADAARVKSLLRRQGTAALNCAVDGGGTGYVALTGSAALAIGVAEAAGTFVVDACFEDAAGNRSAAVASDDILFDAAAPAATIVLAAGALFTTSASVAAAITFADALGARPTTLRFSSSLSFSGPTEAFASSKAGLVVSAPTVEGDKTVCVEVGDELGRIATACDAITLDLSPPAGTLTAPAFATASPFDVTVRSDDVNIASAAVGEALDCGSASFTALARSTSVTRSVAFADATTETTHTVVACFQDAAGQIARVERVVGFDPTNPPLAQPTAPANASFSSTRRPTFTWAAVTGAVRFNLQVRLAASPNTVVLDQPGLTALTFTPTSDLPETALQWIVIAQKPSGRTSTASFTGAATLTIDATAPTAASGIVVAVDAGRARITTPAPCSAASPCINDNTPRLSFTPGTDANAGVVHTVAVARASDPGFNAPVFSTSRTDGSVFDVGAALDDDTYAVRVTSTDRAGNARASTVVSFIVDRTAPDVPSILPLRTPVSSLLAGDINVGWTAEGPTGAVGYRFQLTTEARTFASPIVDEGIDGVTNTSRAVKSLLEAGAHVVHQVRVASVDALGNRSAFAVAAFANDTTPPCARQKTVRVIGSDGDDFTNTSAVVVDISCLSDPADPFDGPARMQVGCDGAAAGKPFVAFSNVATCVLPGVDGPRSVAIVVTDEAGNPTTAFSDSITVDRAAPTAPVLDVDSVITNDPGFDIAILEPSIDVNLARHEFIDGVEVTSYDDPRALVPGSLISLTMTAERTYNVRVRGADRAGNVSAEALATVTLDITPPLAPVIANGDIVQVVDADTFTFFLDAEARDVHLSHYELALCTGTPCTSASSFLFSAVPGDGTFTVPLTADTRHTFRLRGVDLAGNTSAAAFDQIVVVEDSRNPRPLALAPLPPFTNGGTPQAFASSTFTSRGAYADVHFARSETNLAASAIDANFDHFEVRCDAFEAFVPVCATATALCPIPFTTDRGLVVDGTDVAIFAGANIVGFRVPLVRGVENAITVRSVDKAGNVSLEETVVTTETSVVRVTDDDLIEAGYSLFGDRLAFVRSGDLFVRVREPGPDALFGTADDTVIGLREHAGASTSAFGDPQQVIAQGPDMIAHPFQNGGNKVILGFTPGPDETFSAAADNVQILLSNNPAIAGDELLDAEQPSIWLDRIVWRERVSSTDTDIVLRDGGADRVLGNGDDRFARIANDAVFQSFPQISGDNVAFFQCTNASCTAAGDPRLVVANAGVDRLLGTVDDVVRTLTQASDIRAAVRPQLYTPGTAGRPACRNVIAWVGNAVKGVFVVAAGPDGLFDADDKPVQVMNREAQSSGVIGGFSLHDDVVIANDFFAPPSLEVVTGGPDGCLTRTADNVIFDSGLQSGGSSAVVSDRRIVATVFSPTTDLVLLELGAERALWPRPEGADFINNVDVDMNGIAMSAGGVLDLARNRLDVAFSASSREVHASRDVVIHGTSSAFFPGGGPPQFGTLNAVERGIDAIWGTADDRTVVLGGSRRLSVDNNGLAANGATFGLDGTVAVWAGDSGTGTSVVPVLHSAGADGRYDVAGDDCEVVLAAPAPGYTSLRQEGRRTVFQSCTQTGCGSGSGGDITVREVTGDVCTGAVSTAVLATGPATSFADVDGPRLIFRAGSDVVLIEGGIDQRLTTTGDNTTRILSHVASGITGAPRISGDRVVWVDSRFATERVVIADIADGSERVLSRTPTGNSAPTIEGDLIAWRTDVTGTSFTTDVIVGHLGLQPDLPQDARAAPPTRLRCPDDDRFEENDSRLTATSMNGGAVLGAIVCSGDADNFVVDVPAGGCVVRAKVGFAAADGNLDVQLFDAADALVASSANGTGLESITFNATRSGAHRIRVFGVGTASNTYDVGVTVTCP